MCGQSNSTNTNDLEGQFSGMKPVQIWHLKNVSACLGYVHTRIRKWMWHIVLTFISKIDFWRPQTVTQTVKVLISH